MPKRSTGTKQPSSAGVFICYRRSDTQGYAGRLEDSLKNYFGADRVFRDVSGITPGEDFERRIEETIGRVAALIVLIGPDWLAGDAGGLPRLHAPGDTVASEIAAALAQGRLIIPVLVHGATMPRADELPDELKELARRNAVAINDEGWDQDVTRLAKILAFDVAGSVAERRLDALKLGVCSLLALPMVFTLLVYVATEPDTFNQTIWYVVANPVAIALACLVLATTITWIEASRRKYVWAAIALGFPGLLVVWVPYLLHRGDHALQGDIAFASTSTIITGMLALLGLSGFKPNDGAR